MSTEGSIALQDDNPYASPLAAGEIASQFPAELWRFNDLVVAHRQAVWPRRCVKTGNPCENPMKIAVATQYPNWLLLPLFGVPWLGMAIAIFLPQSVIGLYVGLGILAVVVIGVAAGVTMIFKLARRTEIEIFVSEGYLAERQKQLWGAVVSHVVSVVGVVASGYIFPFIWMRWTGIIVSILVGVSGGGIRAKWGKILTPTKTKPEYLVLGGASPLFLESLPTWPYGPI